MGQDYVHYKTIINVAMARKNEVLLFIKSLPLSLNRRRINSIKNQLFLSLTKREIIHVAGASRVIIQMRKNTLVGIRKQ